MNYIFNKEQYLAAKAQWKKKAYHDARDHIIYNIIRGFDPKRGFTETTNPSKLGNGWNKWKGFEIGLMSAKVSFAVPKVWPAENESLNKIFNERMAGLTRWYGVEITMDKMMQIRGILG